MATYPVPPGMYMWLWHENDWHEMSAYRFDLHERIYHVTLADGRKFIRPEHDFLYRQWEKPSDVPYIDVSPTVPPPMLDAPT